MNLAHDCGKPEAGEAVPVQPTNPAARFSCNTVATAAGWWLWQSTCVPEPGASCALAHHRIVVVSVSPGRQMNKAYDVAVFCLWHWMLELLS